MQPVYLHGSLGREAATGRGTVFAIRELLKALHMGRVQDQRYVIQVSRAQGRRITDDSDCVSCAP